MRNDKGEHSQKKNKPSQLKKTISKENPLFVASTAGLCAAKHPCRTEIYKIKIKPKIIIWQATKVDHQCF